MVKTVQFLVKNRPIYEDMPHFSTIEKQGSTSVDNSSISKAPTETNYIQHLDNEVPHSKIHIPTSRNCTCKSSSCCSIEET